MIFITGANGYLGEHIINSFPYETFIKFDERLNISLDELVELYGRFDITHVYHLASPTTEEDFKKSDKHSLYSDIVKGTTLMIEFCNLMDAELVYFSTEGIIEPKNLYSKFKKITTELIPLISNYYKILIIPRVYSHDRKKGLIAKLKSKYEFNEDELNKKIEYISLESFLYQFNDFIRRGNAIFYFRNKQIHTIRELREKYA